MNTATSPMPRTGQLGTVEEPSRRDGPPSTVVQRIPPTSGPPRSAVGWQGLAIAEEHGGSGFGLSELSVVLEAQGRELCPGPFLPSVSAAVVIDRCAPDAASGPTTSRARPTAPSVAALGLSGNITVGSDLVVTGESPAVLGAPDAVGAGSGRR